MNTIDIVIAVILIYALVKGWLSGIIVQLAGIAGILAGIWVASYFSVKISSWLGMDNVNSQVMYIVTLIVVMVLVILLLNLLDRLLKGAGLSAPIRILGMIFSVGKWLLILTLVLSVYKSIVTSWHLGMSETVTSSVFYKPLTEIEKHVFPYIKEVGNKAVNYKN